jgi:hypothetical protein
VGSFAFDIKRNSPSVTFCCAHRTFLGGFFEIFLPIHLRFSFSMARSAHRSLDPPSIFLFDGTFRAPFTGARQTPYRYESSSEPHVAVRLEYLALHLHCTCVAPKTSVWKWQHAAVQRQACVAALRNHAGLRPPRWYSRARLLPRATQPLMRSMAWMKLSKIAAMKTIEKNVGPNLSGAHRCDSCLYGPNYRRLCAHANAASDAVHCPWKRRPLSPCAAKG